LCEKNWDPFIFRKVFTDPRSGRVYEEGDILQRPLLADTLEELANATDPVELFYKGGIAQTIAAEIQENGGHITAEDLANYETIFHETPLESCALTVSNNVVETLNASNSSRFRLN
jgi:gamma-glutamyltranspeptidase